MSFTRQHLKRGAAFLLAALALCYLTDFGKAPVTASLDQSWIAVIAWAAKKPLQFGRDIIFTNGPLGYVLYPTNLALIYWPAFALKLAINSLLVAMLFILSETLHLLRRVALILTALVATYHNSQTSYVLMVVLAGWQIFAAPRPRRILQIASVGFLAVALLMKGTLLFLALFVVIEGWVVLAWRRKWNALAFTFAGFVTAFLGSWLLARQNFSNIPRYFATSWNLMQGYGEAMSIPPQATILAAGLTIMAFMSAQIVSALVHHPHERSAWFISLALMVALFLVWRMSFTRADIHTVQLSFYGIPAVLALPMLFRDGPCRIPPKIDYATLIVVLVCGGYVIHQATHFTPVLAYREAQHRLASTFVALVSPAQTYRKVVAASETEARNLALPQIRNAVGRSTVDVFGYEQAVAIANNLNYTPRPGIQSYCATTARLIKANAAFYRSARAPQYAICKLQTIDGHIPALDDAEALLILLADYEPVLAENRYTLLRRIEKPARVDIEPIRSGEAGFNESIPVPEGIVWCRLHLRPTLLGRLAAFVYQLPPVTVTVQPAKDTPATYRLIREPAAEGFLLNPFLTSDRTTVDFQDRKIGEAIEAVAIGCSGRSNWLMKPRVSYEFAQVTITEIANQASP